MSDGQYELEEAQAVASWLVEQLQHGKPTIAPMQATLATALMLGAMVNSLVATGVTEAGHKSDVLGTLFKIAERMARREA